MKIETFATLEAVLQTGTFVGGARLMNITPSAVSMQMKQLEVYLGKPLFDRSGLQVRPTQLAHEVADTLRDALKGLEALRSGTPLAIEGVVRIGIIESMQPAVLPGMLRYIRTRHPKLDVVPVRGRSSQMLSALKAGEIDAALVAQPPEIKAGRLSWTPMLRRELVIVTPPDTADTPIPTLFRQLEWIRYDRKTVTGSMAAQYVASQIGDVRSTLEFDNASAIVAMVSSGLGLSVVQRPDPATLHSYPVRIFRLGKAAPILQLSMVTRKVDGDSRPLNVVREAMAHASMEYQKRLST
ncbi:LysR family transcriptional regulator [Bordetella sp. 02P26C-1]|uniref:LysR family transcriptional regulator n=1 Tax=Bordetella sp. 02P26C-1 TaxID=2683195 RepID=UPI0013557BA6|nr:LysR family transcriptional regulator [Bordetella sp. 02P26C-1]MVW77567.1 LysR family transcriptional regulator [Bordetella sp. 02P26C-1]